MHTISKTGTFTLLAVASLTIMVGCVIVPGLTEIAENLGTLSAASWLVTIPSLGVVIFGPFAGRLIDSIGPHRSLRWGLFLYGVFGAGGVFLHGIVPVLIDRLLLGGVTAVVMSAGTGLISIFFSGEARLKMIATQGMSIELGGVIFLFIGGLLTTIGWQWPFAIYLVSWYFLAMLIMFVPDPELHSDITNGNSANNGDDQPNGSLAVVYFAAFFSLVCFFTGIIIIPQRFHQLMIGTAETGYFLSFVSLIAVFAAAVMPKVVLRINDRYTLYLAFLCYALAHLSFVFAGDITIFIIGGILMGCGFGLSVPLVNHMAIERSEDVSRGKNLAYLSMAIFSGQFMSSFMEFIPGSLSVVFLGVSILSIVVIISLAAFNNISNRKNTLTS